ncbi:MAG: HD domain-containing protein [Gemmatimonadaceae bacterium]
MDSTELALPDWARVSERRRAHIARVTTMLLEWCDALDVPREERAEWRDAGLLHDALRDTGESELRAWAPDSAIPTELLHGPAVAQRLVLMGETRHDLLEAIRWHTVGCARWARTGRALYMADYLEPGRPFARADRAFLATHVPRDFDGAFRQVVRHRVEWCLREGFELFPSTVALWNSVR